MLIDEVLITIEAGRGGQGRVAFNKTLMSLGPTGGKGGKGGDVYFQGVSDLSALKRFRFKKEFKAENGKNGQGQFCDGADGQDLILLVPKGTMIQDLEKGKVFEVTEVNEKILVAQGGQGGQGNFYFKSSTNTSPKEFEYGQPGESLEVRLELKLIADIGLIGLPNVGKTSLLNRLTNSQGKVADYSFTTLEPNLGDYYGLILADIPGLIQGAATGKGLGIKFLKHIERTETLFHLIAADSKDPAKDYQTVRNELKEYNEKLLEKKEIILVSKKDLVSLKEIELIRKKIKKEVLFFSIHDSESIKEIEKLLK
jgi:GTP-binding protein